MRLALAIVGALTLAACASTGEQVTSSHQAELDRLRDGCNARNGTLIPSGRNTGQPPLDYVCDIRGPASGPRR